MLRAVKEVEEAKPDRAIGVFIKVSYMEKKELEEILKAVMPGGTVTTISRPEWVESSYRPV